MLKFCVFLNWILCAFSRKNFLVVHVNFGVATMDNQIIFLVLLFSLFVSVLPHKGKDDPKKEFSKKKTPKPEDLQEEQEDSEVCHWFGSINIFFCGPWIKCELLVQFVSLHFLISVCSQLPNISCKVLFIFLLEVGCSETQFLGYCIFGIGFVVTVTQSILFTNILWYIQGVSFVIAIKWSLFCSASTKLVGGTVHILQILFRFCIFAFFVQCCVPKLFFQLFFSNFHFQLFLFSFSAFFSVFCGVFVQNFLFLCWKCPCSSLLLVLYGEIQVKTKMKDQGPGVEAIGKCFLVNLNWVKPKKTTSSTRKRIGNWGCWQGGKGKILNQSLYLNTGSTLPERNFQWGKQQYCPRLPKSEMESRTPLWDKLLECWCRKVLMINNSPSL